MLVYLFDKALHKLELVSQKKFTWLNTFHAIHGNNIFTRQL